jgi:hypothetical protein
MSLLRKSSLVESCRGTERVWNKDHQLLLATSVQTQIDINRTDQSEIRVEL